MAGREKHTSVPYCNIKKHISQQRWVVVTKALAYCTSSPTIPAKGFQVDVPTVITIIILFVFSFKTKFSQNVTNCPPHPPSNDNPFGGLSKQRAREPLINGKAQYG